jgi:hypothetical protein
MEGPKNLFDPSQMADWYVKLLADHPLISYIEDPFSEIEGYKQFPEKLSEAGLDSKVKFGLKNFHKGSIEKLKELTEYFEKEEDADDSDEEQVSFCV